MRIRLNVFGRLVAVERLAHGWQAFYIGADGKRGIAEDIIIPPRIQEHELVNYIADLCHEWADPDHTDVTIVS